MKYDVLSVKDTTERVLSSDVRARNNDKWLNLCVLRAMGFHIYIPYNELDNMPSFESISRCRRKLQEEGKYLPNPVVEANRKEEEKEMIGINKWF